MKLTAIAWFDGLFSYFSVEKMSSSSMPVPSGLHLEHVQVGQLCRACRSSGSSTRAPARARCRSSPMRRRSCAAGTGSCRTAGWTIVTPLFFAGFMPFFVSAAKSSYWLPPSQYADLLAPHLRDRVDAASPSRSARSSPSARRPARSLTSLVPLSRAANRLGSQSTPNCAWPDGDDLLRDDVRAAVLQRHVEARASCSSPSSTAA